MNKEFIKLSAKGQEVIKKKCDILNQGLGHIVECFIPGGITLEVLQKQLENVNRVGVPIFLDPKTATWLDVAIHAKARQNLDTNTIEKHLRSARFMNNHKQPVDFRNITIESVIRHFDYRITFENATRDALRHERDAVYMFLRAFKMFTPEWKEYLKLPKKVGQLKKPYVVFPNVLNQMYHAEYSNNEYENVLFQTIVFVLANFGMRPPSEIINMNIDNLVVNNDGTGYLWICEDKKGNSKRQYIPYDKKILSSKVYRTPLNYLKTWRQQVENGKSGDAFLLQLDGRRVSGKYIRDHIVPVGKILCKDNRFKLYSLRHTFATYYYNWTKDIKKVADLLGHTKTDSIDYYINIAEDLSAQVGKKSNLFNQALRQPLKEVGGKPEKRDSEKKTALFQLSSSVNEYGPGEILTRLKEKKKEIEALFYDYLRNVNSLIKTFFSFFVKEGFYEKPQY